MRVRHEIQENIIDNRYSMSIVKRGKSEPERITFLFFHVTHPVDTIHGNSKLIIRFANNMLQAHCARHIEDYIRIYR